MKHTAWPVVAACAGVSVIFGSVAAWATSSAIINGSTGSGTSLPQNVVRQEVTETNVKSDVINVVKQTSPSVVSIIVSKELVRYKMNPRDYITQDPFFDQFYQQAPGQQPSIVNPRTETEKQQVAGGTGFIVTADGKVITNKHVVADAAADYTVVMNDGTEYAAKVISRDPSNDLAVIQMQPKEGQTLQNITPLRLATSDSVEVGQVIVAIGNALGEFNNTVTMGVISAKDRSIAASDGGMSQEGYEQLSNLLQTDAAINPGNSGGPLLSLDGAVVGVSTAIAQSANGIGFAIPVDEVDFVLRSVNKYGKIVRPFLGVVYRANSPEIAKQFNLKVDYGAILQDGVDTGERAVVKDGPGDKAGLQSGDVILSINGEKITKDRDLKDTLTKFLPDDEVSLDVLRAGETITLKLKLGKREDTSVTPSAPDGSQQGEAYLGVYSTPITADLQKRLNLPVGEGALLYNDFTSGTPAVVRDSPAAKAGLQSGDIIISIAGEKITADRTLTAIIGEKKPGDTIEVVMRRGGQEQKLTVTLSDKPKE